MTLSKVIFEYSNGDSKYITGSQLEQWQKFNALVASCAQNHGIDIDWDGIKWTPTKDEETVNFMTYKQENEHPKDEQEEEN